jgi:serine protease Do
MHTVKRLKAEILSMIRDPLAHRAFGAVLVVIAITACSPKASTAAAPASAAPPAAASSATPATSAPAPAVPLVSGLPDFSALVAQAGAAVVNVDTVGRQERTAGVPGVSPDDPFYDFFRRFGIDPRRAPRNSPAPRGQGSGFIVSADGYVLTNAHVVDEAQEVTVRMTNRREYAAKVVGLDRRTDVAVLKIDARDLPTVRIGDPATLRPGEWVVAIGSPFGFENSVTAGVVSGVSRSIPDGDSNYVPFIQTDVAVNPGNSGGPLFNLRGEVVGINSQIYSRSGGYMGLSFAIPIDIANGVREQLVKNGRVRRGRVGIGISEVSAQFAESFGLDRPRGALVGTVEADGPAAKAGLKEGDIVLSVNGRVIERSNELPVVVAGIAPGTKANFEIWRDRGSKTVPVVVGEVPESGNRNASRSVPGSSDGEPDRFGLALRELTPDEQRDKETTGALIVEDVDGPAAAANIEQGDIVLGVNNRRIRSLREWRDATSSAKGTIALLIQRGRDGNQLFVPVRPG